MYEMVKLIHIVAAICWAGGGVTLAVMTYMSRAKDGQDLVSAFRLQEHMGDRWFVPASLTTLLSGLVLATQSQLWSEVWVVASLAGYTIMAATGPLMLKPLIQKTLMSADCNHPAAVASVARIYLKAASFDYSIVGIVIALMVFKPNQSDTIMLAALVALFVAAAGVFFLPALQYRMRKA